MTCPSFLCSNAQRPGAVTAIRMEEYAQRKVRREEGRDLTIIAVKQHKTAGKGAAALMLEPQLAEEVGMWHDYIRAALLPADCELLFAERSGRQYDHLSRKLVMLGHRLGFELTSATDTRKAVVTRAAEDQATAEQRVALAAHMCHDTRTASKHYDKASRLQSKSEGYAYSRSLLRQEGGVGRSEEAEASSLRRKYTKIEEDIIAEHFALAIESRRPPVCTEGREFLQMYPASFKGRSPKDIVDKIRTLIRRAK